MFGWRDDRPCQCHFLQKVEATNSPCGKFSRSSVTCTDKQAPRTIALTSPFLSYCTFGSQYSVVPPISPQSSKLEKNTIGGTSVLSYAFAHLPVIRWLLDRIQVGDQRSRDSCTDIFARPRAPNSRPLMRPQRHYYHRTVLYHCPLPTSPVSMLSSPMNKMALATGQTCRLGFLVTRK